jgi:branched-subunit amino acid transport protein
MFEIQPMSPEHYRRQTRRSTLVIVLLFLLLAMLCATAITQLFGTPGGDNFKWNLIGVLAGLALTVAFVRLQLWSRPFMAAAVYGWRLKRSLMRVTNQMHQVKAGVARGDEQAMKLLRFYHLGLTQMHQLDGNSGELSQLVREIDAHREAMEQRGLDPLQQCLDPAWLEAAKGFQ